MFGSVCENLAKRGHQVDVISHFPLKTPLKNYNDLVDLNGTRLIKSGRVSVENAQSFGMDTVGYIAGYFGNDLCQTLGHSKIQEFVKTLHQRGPYDLIITEVNTG